MNFRPHDSKVRCSSVSCSFDRFLIYCLRDLMALQKRFLPLCYLCRFLSLFPLLLRSLIRHKGKIHFVYSHVLVVLTLYLKVLGHVPLSRGLCSLAMLWLELFIFSWMEELCSSLELVAVLADFLCSSQGRFLSL